ncbi:MAG: hypothetical protein JRN59_00715 [Nitrososphaerota archaeon]|jgi:hypothetical protein|nr:hypothetical protein [Nitrososphaerota archaeon]
MQRPTPALVLRVGRLMAENVFVTSAGKSYLYDLHAAADGDGLIMTTEVLGYKESGYGQLRGGTVRLGEDAYLLPYSGFTFASNDLQRCPDVGLDDHVYYQGPVVRGVELVVEGVSHGALRSRTERLLPLALARLARVEQKAGPQSR